MKDSSPAALTREPISSATSTYTAAAANAAPQLIATVARLQPTT